MITASGWRRAGRTARLLLSAAARRRLCHCHAEAAPDKGRTDRRAAQKSCDMRSTSDHPKLIAYRRIFEQLDRSEEHTSELQSRGHLVCRLLLEKKKKNSTRAKGERFIL